MLNSECNGGRQPAGFIADDGRLWFPTHGRRSRHRPRSRARNSQPPPVMIESVVRTRLVVDFGRGVNVAPGQRDLEIAYTGLSFIKPEQVKFKLQAGRAGRRLGGRGDAARRLFPISAARPYTFPRDRGQQRRRLERTWRGDCNRRGAAVLAHVVVSLRSVPWASPERIFLLSGAASHAWSRRMPRRRLLAPVARFAGARAAAHRRRIARQSGAEPADHQKPRLARRAIA